jgi:hypothetical protein
MRSAATLPSWRHVSHGDQAAEHALQTWAALTDGRDIREVALIADAANTEIDRLNAHKAANSNTTRSHDAGRDRIRA